MPQIQEQYNCPIKLTMDLIGGKWKITILWFLNEGTKRFNEIQRFLPDIIQKILTQQLREMEANNLITRQIFAEIPPRVEYTSTDSGKHLQEIFTQMCHWGNQYALDHNIIINCGKS